MGSTDRYAPRILLASHDEYVHKVHGETLASLGGKIVVATDGVEALMDATWQVFDLAFLDINMPDMNGFDVARTVRRDNLRSHTWFAAITDEHSTSDRAHYQAAGFDFVIRRKIRKEKLFAVVSALLATTRPLACVKTNFID